MFKSSFLILFCGDQSKNERPYGLLGSLHTSAMWLNRDDIIQKQSKGKIVFLYVNIGLEITLYDVT